MPEYVFSAETEDIQSIDMISIPAGSFDIGGQGQTVTLEAFHISQTEITQAQFKAVMGYNPSHFTGDDNRPVECVNWYEAVTFCNRLSEASGFEPCYDPGTWECDSTRNGFRLSTEHEWEYACRAGTRSLYYTGWNASDLYLAAWYSHNSSLTTHAVGGKEANAFGLYDMHGNVLELINVFYEEPPFDDYLTGVRGGCWNNDAQGCESSSGSSFGTICKSYFAGFRVARRQ